EFFSEHLEAREYLPVAEMERVSCSDSCPGLFSQLKEVYLFGCNTMNPEALKSASAEVGRSLVRSGYSRADAERLSRALSARHGESSRDRMRLIFKDVPVIYGFSSVAPLGPTAASFLGRYFQTAGTGEVGSGRASARGFASAREHRTRQCVTGEILRLHARRRSACSSRADARVGGASRLAFAGRETGRDHANDQRSDCQRRRNSGGSRPGLFAEQGPWAEPGA